MGELHLTLAPAFGCVVFDVVLSWIVVFWMGIKVGMARRKYGVKYPAMYSEKEPMFNCIQRAHQNTLEAYPQFLIFLILGGLQHPAVSSIAGLVYIISRIFYAHGYYTGVPANRNWGVFGYLGLFTLIGCTISLALHLVGYL